MPVPRWVARINRRLFNPREIAKGKRPVLRHVGRSSGKTYRTPLDAHQAGDSYFFVMMYGPETDWARNIVAAGNAVLEVGGEEIGLENPRVVDREQAWGLLAEGTSPPPGWLKVSQMLQMDVAGT